MSNLIEMPHSARQPQPFLPLMAELATLPWRGLWRRLLCVGRAVRIGYGRYQLEMDWSEPRKTGIERMAR